MIKISVDEAVAFDMLSINFVKLANTADCTVLSSTLALMREIKDHIGTEKFDAILASTEYDNLHRANIKVYQKIDSVKIVEKLGDAALIDSLNHERYLAKKKIQEKFFNNSLTEKKFGYKQND